MPAEHLTQVVSKVRSAAYERSGSPEVSVVVSTHDRSGFIGGLFAALESQSLDHDRFEVLIVDDGSRDDTWDRVTALADKTQLRLLALRLDTSLGQGTGRNIGLAHAAAEVVAFTDDDCIPNSEWLERLTSRLVATGGTEAQHVVVQGRTVPWPEDGDEGPWARTVWVVRPTWLFETCNIAYRKSDLAAVGGFAGREGAPTSRSGKAVGEDAILGWRVVEHGAGFVYDDSAIVHHRHLAAGYREWLLDHRGKAVFPGLISRSPLARRALWCRYFLAPRTAALELGLVGALAFHTTRRAHWLALTAPWVWLALPEAAARRGRHPILRLGQLALGDLVGVASLAQGSIRARTLVL